MVLTRCASCGNYFQLNKEFNTDYYRGDGVDCPKCHRKVKHGDGARVFAHCIMCGNSFGIANVKTIEEFDILMANPICPICREKEINKSGQA